MGTGLPVNVPAHIKTYPTAKDNSQVAQEVNSEPKGNLLGGIGRSFVILILDFPALSFATPLPGILEFTQSSNSFPPRDVPGGNGRDIKLPPAQIRGADLAQKFWFRIPSTLSEGGEGGGGKGGVCDGETSSASSSLPGISPSETSSAITSEGGGVLGFATGPCFCRTSCAKKLVADILSSFVSFLDDISWGLLGGEVSNLVDTDVLKLLQTISKTNLNTSTTPINKHMQRYYLHLRGRSGTQALLAFRGGPGTPRSAIRVFQFFQNIITVSFPRPTNNNNTDDFYFLTVVNR